MLGRIIVATLVGAVLLGAAGQAYAGYFDNYGSTPGSNWSAPSTWRVFDAEVPSGGPGAGDSVYVYNSLVYDLGASGSVGGFSQDPGCTFTLLQNLTVAGDFGCMGEFNMNGHDITAASLQINGTGFSLVNKGKLTSYDCINLGSGANITLDGNDSIAAGVYSYSGSTLGLGSVGGNVGFAVANDSAMVTAAPGYVTQPGFYFDVRSNGTLRVEQGAGQASGVTYAADAWRGLHQMVEPGGLVQLVFDAGSAGSDWVFKTTADSISDLQGMITDGRLQITGAAYQIINDGTYTIVQAAAAGPLAVLGSDKASGPLALGSAHYDFATSTASATTNTTITLNNDLGEAGSTANVGVPLISGTDAGLFVIDVTTAAAIAQGATQAYNVHFAGGAAAFAHTYTATLTLSDGTTTFTYDLSATTAGPHTGDVDMDGTVNLADFSILKAHYSQSGYSTDPSDWTGWLAGDLDKDGSVGLADFSLLKAHYNHTGDDATSPLVTVPEPCSAAAMLLGVAGLVRRRRSA